jgi:hypothetical protein
MSWYAVCVATSWFNKAQESSCRGGVGVGDRLSSRSFDHGPSAREADAPWA